MPFKRKRILILGAGGATRGALMPFLTAQPKEIVIANRTVSKAQELVNINAAYGNISACSYEDLSNEKFDIILNFTSSGLIGELPPVPPSVFKKAKLAYELSYGKGKTPFLKLAEAHSNALLKDKLNITDIDGIKSYLNGIPEKKKLSFIDLMFFDRDKDI